MMHGSKILIAIAMLVQAEQSLIAQSADDLFALAAGHYERTEWAECGDVFQLLVATHPESSRVFEAYFFLGESRIQLGHLEMARAAFQNFLVRQTNHPHAEKATFRIAEIAYLQNDEHGANLCEVFLRDYPQSNFQAFAVSYLGQLRLRRDEPQLAQRVFERALLDFPQHPLADDNRVGLATALARLGQAEEGKRYLTYVAQNRSDSLGQRARLQLAVIDYQYGHAATAIGQLVEVTAARSLEPSYLAEANVWLARCNVALQRDNEAVTAYESAIQLGVPKNWRATVSLECSLALLRSKQREPAKAQLRSISENWPAHDVAEAALATLARLYYEDQQIDEADVCVTTYLKQYPNGASLNLVREINGRIGYDRKDYVRSEMEFAFLLKALPKETRLIATYKYIHALSLIGLGDYTQGSTELQRISIDELPSEISGGYHLTLGSALQASGKLEDACAEFEKCLAKATTSEETTMQARREMLSAAIQLDRPEIVSEYWTQVSKDNENSDRILALTERVADFAYRHHDWDLATKCYEKLAAEENEIAIQAKGWAGLGWTCSSQNKAVEAREYFARLINRAGDSAAADGAYLALADLQERAGEHLASSKNFATAAKLAKNSNSRQIATLKQSIALHKTGSKDNLQTARQLLADLMDESPLLAPPDQVLYRWAWVEVDLGNQDVGQKLFNRFLTEFKASSVWPDVAFRVAQQKLSEKDFASACELMDKIIARDPPLELISRTQFLIGQIAAANGDWKKVESIMSEVVGSAADAELRRRSEYWLGEAFFQTRRFTDAMGIYERLIKDDSQLEPSLQPWSWLRLSQCQANLEAWPESLATAMASRQKFESFELGYEFSLVAGRSLFSLGRIGEAINEYQTVVADPQARGTETAAQAQWRIGEAYFHQDKFVEAIDAFYRTESLYGFPHWRAASLLEAGKCQEKLGNQKHALKLYRQLVEKFPESEFAEQAKRRIHATSQRAQISQPVNR